MHEREIVELSVTIERKQAGLPRYVVVPSAAIALWRLDGTTVVELSIHNVPVERRTIKKWDDSRWFMSITETDCRRLGVDTGEVVKLSLRLASADLPEELATLFLAEKKARAAWEQLTPGQQRMLREEIGSAKQSVTRARRARKALLEK